MVDISKCKGIDCPLMYQCYRYMAPADKYRQTYADFKYDRTTNKCDSFYPIEKREWHTPQTKEQST
jgi:hypothetical protein